jgi:hypothetical protein
VRMASCNWKPTTVEEIDIHSSTYTDVYSHAARAATLLVK